jgi:hypothetical protein
LGEIMEMNVISKMNGIFDNVMKNNQEWCSDLLLEIIFEILHMASEVKKKQTDNEDSSKKSQDSKDS